MTNILFDWHRLKKSKLLYVPLVASFSIAVLFFLYQFYAVEQVHQKNIEQIEFEISYRERSIELSDLDEDDEYMDEEFLAYLMGRIDSDENQIPYLNQSLKMYLSGNHDEYYEARMGFIEAVSREEGDFVDSSWLFSEEDYEIYLEDLAKNTIPLADDDPLLDEYERLLVYQVLGEPVESEDASIAMPNHLILLGQTVLFPLILSFLIIMVSLLMIEDRTEDSIRLRTIETGSNVLYLLSSSLFAIIHFIFFVASMYVWSSLLIVIFGGPLFNESPSWQSPVLINEEVIEGMTFIRFFIIINLTLIVSYLVFFTLFQLISKLLRQNILSIITLITVTMVGYYLTESFDQLQHWINPFQLFFFEQFIVSGQVHHIFYGLIIALLFSVIGFTIVSNEKRV